VASPGASLAGLAGIRTKRQIGRTLELEAVGNQERRASEASMSRPLSHGRSGNPKGRPKRKGEGLPYARILDRMVTIKDGRGARQVTAEEAFLLYLRKKALDGNEAAQERLEEIQAFRRERDPDLGPGGITTIVRVIVSRDNPNYALRILKMPVKLYPFQPHAQIKLEPWFVQRALDRLGDRRLNTMERATVVAATQTPRKVRWPDWWET
jgi:hypothetical protein